MHYEMKSSSIYVSTGTITTVAHNQVIQTEEYEIENRGDAIAGMRKYDRDDEEDYTNEELTDRDGEKREGKDELREKEIRKG